MLDEDEDVGPKAAVKESRRLTCYGWCRRTMVWHWSNWEHKSKDGEKVHQPSGRSIVAVVDSSYICWTGGISGTIFWFSVRTLLRIATINKSSSSSSYHIGRVYDLRFFDERDRVVVLGIGAPQDISSKHLSPWQKCMGDLSNTRVESASLLKVCKCGCHLVGVALQSPRKQDN